MKVPPWKRENWEPCHVCMSVCLWVSVLTGIVKRHTLHKERTSNKKIETHKVSSESGLVDTKVGRLKWFWTQREEHLNSHSKERLEIIYSVIGISPWQSLASPCNLKWGYGHACPVTLKYNVLSLYQCFFFTIALETLQNLAKLSRTMRAQANPGKPRFFFFFLTRTLLFRSVASPAAMHV